MLEHGDVYRLGICISNCSAKDCELDQGWQKRKKILVDLCYVLVCLEAGIAGYYHHLRAS